MSKEILYPKFRVLHLARHGTGPQKHGPQRHDT
jgi:hypothetical protein